MRSLILTTVLVSSLALAACGGDDDSASAATAQAPTTTAAPPAASSDVEAYCARLAGLDDGRDPGFDQFFTDHPEPTLDDWAAFLPGPIAMLSDMVDEFDGIDPPSELVEEHTAVLDAMAAVRDAFQLAFDLAEAGDQAAFDEAGQAPGDAMEEAMATLGAACGLED
jgi:ABC-type glycerol-3-phosphate transport system substrate-binding protein